MQAFTKFSVTAVAAAALWSADVATAQAPAEQDPQGGQSKIEIMRTALSEWTKAKDTISAERAQWKEQKQVLETQVRARKNEIEALEGRIAETRKSIASAAEKYGDLDQKIAAQKAVQKVLEERIGALEQRVLGLLPRLPESLARNVEPLSQQLPTTPEKASELALSTRYQNVIGVLNMIDKWNREVRIESEMRSLAGGEEVRVDVLYIGLGQAYYVGGRTEGGKPTVAGVGSPSDEGWQWRPANELAESIQTAVSIYKNEKLAALVRLPVQIL